MRLLSHMESDWFENKALLVAKLREGHDAAEAVAAVSGGITRRRADAALWRSVVLVAVQGWTPIRLVAISVHGPLSGHRRGGATTRY